MPRYRYLGSDERTFPSLGAIVQPGDVFDDRYDGPVVESALLELVDGTVALAGDPIPPVGFEPADTPTPDVTPPAAPPVDAPPVDAPSAPTEPDAPQAPAQEV